MSRTPRLLCEGALRVSIDGGGPRTLLVVSDGATLRFWAETSDLEGVLDGIPVQLSSHGGFCHIERTGEWVSLDYALAGEGTKRCALPAADLRAALAWVRSLPPPHEPAGATL